VRRHWGLAFLLASCAESPQLGTREEGLTICDGGQCFTCNGNMSTTQPSDGRYVMTTFGGGSDTQPVACGGRDADGMWYYAADRQRFGCGTHLKVENPANGACVILQVADAGPDICVEQAAGKPVLDVSPLASQHLFGTSGSGWSDGRIVHVTVTSESTLGPCPAPPPPPPVDASTPPAMADASTPDAGAPDASTPPAPQNPDASVSHEPNPAAPDRLYGGCSVTF
jgi:hypothetical protein